MMTKEEKAWIRKVQRALDSCPNKEKFGFYTIGDPDVTIYDKTLGVDEAFDCRTWGDFGHTVNEFDAQLGSFNFPSGVHSVAG